MWNHKRDMATWETIAQEAHARHSKKAGLYVQSQSVVEHFAHARVAEQAQGAERVLEIGVGGGEHLVYRRASTGTERYVGLDLSPEYAQICREKFGIEVVCADAASLPFDDAAFDCVIAVSILEHVQNVEKTLAEVKRVLVPGGRFLVIVPTNGSLAISLFKAVMTYPSMRWRGIERPDMVWNYLNVNNFKRVQSLLYQNFPEVEEMPVPLGILPWWLSPLWSFRCIS